jgi:hypothetical protein
MCRSPRPRLERGGRRTTASPLIEVPDSTTTPRRIGGETPATTADPLIQPSRATGRSGGTSTSDNPSEHAAASSTTLRRAPTPAFSATHVRGDLLKSPCGTRSYLARRLRKALQIASFPVEAAVRFRGTSRKVADLGRLLCARSRIACKAGCFAALWRGDLAQYRGHLVRSRAHLLQLAGKSLRYVR